MSFGFQFKNEADDDSVLHKDTNNNQDDVGQPPPLNPVVSKFSHSTSTDHGTSSDSKEFGGNVIHGSASTFPDASFGFKDCGSKMTSADQSLEVILYPPNNEALSPLSIEGSLHDTGSLSHPFSSRKFPNDKQPSSEESLLLPSDKAPLTSKKLPHSSNNEAYLAREKYSNDKAPLLSVASDKSLQPVNDAASPPSVSKINKVQSPDDKIPSPDEKSPHSPNDKIPPSAVANEESPHSPDDKAPPSAVANEESSHSPNDIAPPSAVTIEESSHSTNNETPTSAIANKELPHSPNDETPAPSSKESLQYRDGEAPLADLSSVDKEEYCHISLLLKSENYKIFRNGLILYFNNKSYCYDIAEAPLQLNPAKKLKPIAGTLEICISENNSTNHVRCHDLRKEGPEGLGYFIEEVYEPSKHIVAVLLINSADTLTLNPDLDLHILNVNIPVYIVSSVHGDEIIHHIRNARSSSSDCQCEFVFFNEVKDKFGVPNQLTEHLRNYLFPRKKLETVTDNRSLFKYLTNAFADEELPKNSANFLSAVNELRENMHEVFNQEFLFLIVLVSGIKSCKDRIKSKTKVIDALYNDTLQHLLHLDTSKIAPVVNKFYQRGDFNIKVFGSSTSHMRSVFHLLHTNIFSILHDFKKKMWDEKNDSQFCLYLGFMIKWIHTALMFRNCSHSPSCYVDPLSIWIDFIVPACEDNLAPGVVATLTASFTVEQQMFNLPHETTFVGSGGLEHMLRKSTVLYLFCDLRNIVVHMKSWIKNPEDFVKFFCQVPLLIHTQTFSSSPNNYKGFSVGKKTNKFHIVKEGFSYLDDFIQCFHSVFTSSDPIYYENIVKDWMIFLFKFLNIADKNYLPVIKEILNYKHIFYCSSLSAFFNSEVQIQIKERSCSDAMSLSYFTDLSKICNKGLWSVEVVSNFFECYVKRLESDSVEFYASSLSHFSECFRGAFAHKFLVNFLLKPIAKSVSNKGKAENYVVQLIQLDVKHLLKVHNEEDDKVVQSFAKSLKDYVSQNRRSINFSKERTFQKIVFALESANEFNGIVLDIVAKDLYLLPFDKIDNQWLSMLKFSTDQVILCMKNDLNVMNHPSRFYWQIIGGLSNKMKRSHSLDPRIQNDFFFIYQHLHSILGSKRYNSDIEAYLSFIEELKKGFNCWKLYVSEKNVTFDEICTLLKKNDADRIIADEFKFENAVVDEETLKSAKQEFITCHEKISQLLIKMHPQQRNWVMLNEILNAYRVVIPEDINLAISKSFYFPHERPSNALQDLPSQKKHIVYLFVKKSLKLKEIVDLCNQLEAFLAPIEPFLHFLEHFHLNESQIFHLFIRKELVDDTEILKHLEVSIQNFAEVLELVKGKVLSILTGAAVYSDIASIAGKGMNITRELNIITNCKDLQNNSSYDAVQSFKNVLFLYQIAEHIDALSDFCLEFDLQKCKGDDCFIKLRKIVEAKESWEHMTISTLCEIFQEIRKLLGIVNENEFKEFTFLRLFQPLSTETKELRNFMIENNFRGKGKDRFLELFDLVTQARQHDEYNAGILNPLYAVYYLLVQLNKPDLSFQELIDEVSKLNHDECLSQLKTVNSNIDLIRMWFSKAEGDTVTNTDNELKSITSNGEFHIQVTVKNHNDDKLTLQFRLEARDSSDMPSLSSDQQTTHVITWKNAEVQDFIRRLGFAKLNDRNANVSSFIKLNEMVARLQRSIESLHEMGHPDYHEEYYHNLDCSASLEDVELEVIETEKEAKKMSDHATANRVQYKWLSFLSPHGIIELYRLLKSSKEQSRLDIATKIFKQLRFLMSESQSGYMKHFETAIDFISSDMSPTENVGVYLDKVFQSVVFQSKPFRKDLHSFAVLHQCQKFTANHLIRCLYAINGRFPKCYELLRCHSGTTLSDIQLFFQRIEFFPQHYYFLQVDQLNSKLQEFLIQYYMELYDKMLKCDAHGRSTLHFIETSASLLHNAPYINIVVKSEENLQKVAKFTKSQTQLVYGLQGNGKTHYIRRQLTANNVVIAVNEMFCVGKVLNKLKFLYDEEDCSIFFNFTLLPPGKSVAEEERKKFETLMDKIGWFMFDFLVLGYIQDPHTGAAFSVPLTENWKIFVEVPSIYNDPESSLKTFRELLPTFNFVGTPHHIDSSSHFEIDDDVQLVCKYLKAYKNEQENPGTRKGINKLFNEFIEIPVKFSTEADFDDPKECLSLLDKYMPDYIAERKISQKLFIKYIKRRCQFLDNLPQYNYNAGSGFDGSDTRQLGSTLMNAMLNEVPQFCDPSTKEDWSIQAHQQLIYEGVGSIGLITLYPDQISPEDRKSFTNIGVKILPQGDFFERKILDEYLARALTLPLSEVTEVIYTSNGNGPLIEETRYKPLKLIDDSNYVLTLDFALKMINIHERKECGMPVIIEGETGVGKTALLRMLSKLWNYSYEIDLKSYIHRLKESLTYDERQNMSLQQRLSQIRNAAENEEISTAGGSTEATELKRIVSELRKIALEIRKNPSLSVVLPRHDTKEEFWRIANSSNDDIDTKDLFKLLDAFTTADISTFHKLDVHSGLKTHDVMSFFHRVNEQAKQICIRFKNKSKTPQVTAYLDEINTSSCMGLFKEIIIDRTIDGEAILDNVFIIAACNPLRGDSTIHLQNVKNVWVKPSYYVRELHPTIDYLKWDYGALNHVQEEEYITAKMNDCTKDQPEAFTSGELTYFIVESQNRMRLYANRMLTNKGVYEMEAKKCSKSCVSQRDIQRVFDFYKWLFGTYKTFQRYTTTKEQQVRALLVSLGLVYYLRLQEIDRKSYAKFLNIQCRELLVGCNFTTAFNDELEWYIERMNLPPGIAKTRALKENIFANIACCQTHTPLIIIGEPGTSKTLSFNLVSSTFKGKSSKNEDLKNVNAFHALQPFFYQCSKHTNSVEVENIFRQAIQRQRVFASSNVPTYCVVFMDEAGLPEERHESLKVLHYHLDKREVSFVAITNHALDAAKTNRAISLYRPETSTEDLKILAKDLLRTSTAMTMKSDIINKFCSSFSAMMEDPKYQNFYGQRDFMHFISYIRGKRGSGFLTEDIVLQALERNFNGHENFSEVFDYFLKVMGVSYCQMKHRNVLEMVKESLCDLPRIMESEKLEENELDLDLANYTENNVRYKLIIDSSEDDSAVRYLFSCNILDRQRTQMVACSEFLEESGMHVNTIAEIIHSAENGDTIIMFQTDQIHESFYELFNQRFRIIHDPQKGIKLFTNISIGAHTKPCRVQAQFQCIVVVKKSELKNTPQAFLSRFEKFFFSYNTLCSSISETKPPNLKIIINAVFKKIATFVEQLNASKSFYGYCTPDLQDRKGSDVNFTTGKYENAITTHETLYSLLLSMLPSVQNIYEIGCYIPADHFDDDITEENIGKKCLLILTTAIEAMKQYCGWIVPKVPPVEFQSDCKTIFDHLRRDPYFLDAIQNQFDLGGAVGEALDAMHSVSGDVKIMADDSCLVIAVIVQWLVVYITKQLFHLMTPEALVAHASKIPKFLMKAYFEYQEHFSFRKLIQDQIDKFKHNNWDSKMIASKFIVYTRQSYLIGLLPLVFPNNQAKEREQLLLKNIIYDDLESLKMLKVSLDTSEGEICKEITNFIDNGEQKVFVLIANMQDLTVEMVNYLRLMIEQKESKSIYSDKVFALLLSFPQVQFFNRCYPALFLHGWDHFYLDSLTTDMRVEGISESLRNVVNIKQCFRIALGIQESNDVLSLDLEPLLEVAIPVISARVIVSSSDGEYNKAMSVSARQVQIRQIFFKAQEKYVCTPVGDAFCTLFREYWDNKTVIRFLQDAANFTFQHQSTLSITSYVQTRIKALFFEFLVYMLWLINQDCNLDTLVSRMNTGSYEIVQKVFSSVIQTMFKRLHNLQTLSYVCRNLRPPEDKKFQFPFFNLTYHYMEELIDVCYGIMNKKKPDTKTSISPKKTKEFLEKQMLNEMKNKLNQLIENFASTNASNLSGRDQAIASVILSLQNGDLWQCYFYDFIKLKYAQSDVLTALPKETVEAFSNYFNFEQQKDDYISCLAWLHVCSEIRKTDLNQTIHKLKRLKTFIAHQPQETIATVTQTMITGYKNFEAFIIKRSYESLHESVDDQIALIQWYKLYKDIIQMESLYNSLHDLEEPQLRFDFFKVHIMYSLIHSHRDPTSAECLKFCVSLYREKINSISNISVEYAFSECLSAMKALNCSKSYISSVVNMLLSFMFHTIITPAGLSCYCWFFSTALPESKEQLLQYITPAQYKFYLLLILKLNQLNDEDENDVLKIFQSDLRREIIFLIRSSKMNSKESSIFSHAVDSEKMTLANAYMQIVYLHQAINFTKSKLKVAITKLKLLIDRSQSCKDQSEKCLLHLETEAFAQIFLQVMAYNLADVEGSQMVPRLPPQVETYLESNEMNGSIFCMFLWNRLKSTEKLRRTLIAYYDDKSKFTCLNKCKQVAKDEMQESVEFSLPALIQEGTEVGELYRKTCKVLLDIHQRKQTSDALEELKEECVDLEVQVEFSISQGESFTIKKRNALCMCIWLSSFYDFYLKKVQSGHLASAIHSEMEDYFSEDCIRLIICFINNQLITPQNEQDLPSDPNAPLFEVQGRRIVPIQRQGRRSDPIYKLFFPNKQDDQSRQICNALATVTAAILACPDRSNHLWYHLFSPDKLSGTQVTGFLLDSAIKEGRLYDCGIVLDEEGEYGRPEYLHRAERGILTLHSLYLLLWCNFGTFCMNLLTQRDSNIKGTVISSYQAVRHYCKSQLSLMWLHMTTNMALTDEQLSLLIVCSMKRMIQNSYRRPTGLLHELEKRDEYEKMWHAQIFVPSLKEVENNFASYLSKLKADDLVAKLNLRELSCSYPHVPTLQQFTHFVQRHCASSEQRGKYDVLVKLTNSYSRLQSYSVLLPSLIEFYQWIVTDLSHDLTQEESTKMGICSAVKYASEKYSKDVEKNYTKLFERVQNDYNEYLKVIDFSIGAGACANVQRKNEVPLMNDSVYVFRFLPGGTSDETEEQRDFLFLVIQDIVNFHNNFLREINELIKHNDTLKKYLSTLPDEENAEFAMPRVHPLAVNEYSCILGHNVSNRRSLLELVHKHQTETGYDLDKIQEEIVVHFIAGKLPIDDCQTKLKLQFHYKVMRTEQSKMQHPTELMLTLDQLNDEDMKKSIPQDEGFLTALKYELYTLDYDKLVEVAHCLKTIAEHIIKKIDEGQILKNDIIDQNVGDVLPRIVYDQETQHDSLKVFDDLGMNKLQNAHRVRIVAIPMKHLLTTLQVIVEWIKDGIYDFHTLPKAMKVPLTKEDEEKIFALQKEIDELLEKLKGIVVVLTDCEQDLMKKIDEELDVSIFQYLRNLSLVTDDDENLIKLFPKHIKPRHYMALRICLRKVIICIEEERLDEGSHKNKWSEYVEDLWSEEKLEHLREMATEIDYTQVYDPVKGAYGFDDEEIIAEESIMTEEGDSMPEVSQDSPNLSRPETIIEEAPPVAQTGDLDLSAAAEKVTFTDVSDYLRFLKLDQYIEEFMEMEIDGVALFDIDDETLETLGVDTKKDRLKIKTRFKQWLRKKPL